MKVLWSCVLAMLLMIGETVVAAVLVVLPVEALRRRLDVSLEDLPFKS